MRRLTLFAAGATAAVAIGTAVPRTAVAQRFQGTMRFTVHSSDGKTTEITQLARPGKASFLVNDGGKLGGMIVDSTAGTMTVVSSESKSYMVMSLAMIQQMASRMADAMKNMPNASGNPSDDADEKGGPKGKLTATGRSEVVAGIRCQVYAYDGMENGKHQTGEVCLAKGAGMMAAGANPMDLMPGMHGRARSDLVRRQFAHMGDLGTLLAQGYGILKGSGSEDGKFQGSVEVTSYDPSLPSEAAFEPPAGYSKKEMRGMPGGPN